MKRSNRCLGPNIRLQTGPCLAAAAQRLHESDAEIASDFFRLSLFTSQCVSCFQPTAPADPLCTGSLYAPAPRFPPREIRGPAAQIQTLASAPVDSNVLSPNTYSYEYLGWKQDSSPSAHARRLMARRMNLDPLTRVELSCHRLPSRVGNFGV